MTITYSYIYLTDTYYFYDREIYINRDMFLNVSPDTIVDMLGLHELTPIQRDNFIQRMAQKPVQAHTDTITHL